MEQEKRLIARRRRLHGQNYYRFVLDEQQTYLTLTSLPGGRRKPWLLSYRGQLVRDNMDGLVCFPTVTMAEKEVNRALEQWLQRNPKYGSQV